MTLNKESMNFFKPSRKNKMVFFIGLFLIFGTILSAIFINKAIQTTQNKKTDCVQLNNEVRPLFDKNQPDEVRSKLKPYQKHCGRMLSQTEIRDQTKTTETLAVMEFNAHMARSLYLTGSKVEAKSWASQVIDINKYLSPPQRQRIPEGLALFIAMDDIMNDQYKPLVRNENKTE